jgi:hypothetical protein
MLNTLNPLTDGIVAAYFPGFGAPVVDATDTWGSLVESGYGTAGALTSNGVGRAMSFNGILDGVWCTGSEMPLAGQTQFTIACVTEITGPIHASGGACFSLSQSTSVSNRLLIGCLPYDDSSTQGQFYFNSQMNSVNNTFYAPIQSMPTGVAVLIAVYNIGALTAYYYQNGTLVGTQELASGTSMAGFDTISMGCRITASEGESGCFLTAGSTVMTGPSSNEDITIGSPLSDDNGYIPAGTYCTADSPLGTYTLSQAANGTESNALITWLGPFTRLMNGAVNSGVL